MNKKVLSIVALIMAMSTSAAFQCNIQVPAGSVGASRTATITYSNDGSSAIAAPYVRLEAGDNAFVRFSETDAWSKSIEFLATAEQLPTSSLRVGETVEIPVFVYTATQEAQMTLSYTQSSTEAFPWSSIGSSLKPSYVTDNAWTFALATLKSRFGTTWNSYLSRLRANADYLAENGRPVRRLDNLLQIEINHALGVDAVLPVLASVTDATRSARGMGLSFTRSYSSAMYGRFKNGILGYGWTDNLSTCAELSTDGKTLVFRVPGGGSYSFTKATDSWQPEDARDKTVLKESSTAYTLTYQSGTVQTFAKFNMRTASIVDSSGNTLTFTWSGTTLQKITHTDGQSLTFAYSGGLLSSVTDDCGRRTSYSYSSSLLTKVTASDGLETLYEYRAADGTAAARALSRIVYPDGTTREFAYDTSSGLVSAISVNGGKEKTTISRSGLNVTLTGPDGAATTVSMGVSGETLKTTDALGGIATNVYTEDGLLKSVVSPSGLTGSITHDALGRVGKSVSATGTATVFAYEESFGNLKTVTDAKNHAVTYGYDAYGRGTSVTFADGSASRIEYNSRGDVVKSTNRRGQTVTYTYDSKGQLTKKTWSNGRTFTYSYDAHGNVTTASDSETGTVTMQYDSADRLTKIAYPAGRGFTFSYDSCGRLAVRTSLDGAVERFAYDASGRLSSVKDGNGATYLQNTYDATTGRLTKQVNGNGTSVSYLYDKLGRVVSIEHRDAGDKIVESLQYCYDADGRCIRASSLLGEERYGYDKDGQLTSVRYPDSTSEAFAYDAVGNRTTANGATYTVNNLNQYTAISGGSQSTATAITYDKDGNMTSLTDAKGTTSYTYDTLNRLVAVSNPSAGINWSCRYDVFGNRVSVTDNGVTTERIYLQGSLPSVAAEYVNGELKERHIVVGAVRVADVAATPSSSRYYHADLIGSTRLVTDGNGAIIDRRAYKAFGETRVGGPSSSATATAGYVGTLGVETDPTGLLFMRNRYYSPALGRFIQMDPIGLNGGDVNWYRYCENSPYNKTDVNGLDSALSGFGEVFTDTSLYILADLGVEQSIPAVLGAPFMLNDVFENLQAGGYMGYTLAITDVVKYGLSLNPAWSWVPLAYDLVNLGGQAVAAYVYQSDLSRRLEETLRNQRIDAMQYCIVLVRPNGGSGSGDGGLIMNVNDWIKISTNENASAATYSLGADIELTDPHEFTYISGYAIDTGRPSYSKIAKNACRISGFSGTLNGNGHKISYSSSDGGVLFPGCDGAKFNNVIIGSGCAASYKNCTFTDCVGTLSGSVRGALADEAEGCTFKNCSAAASINCVEDTLTDGIGGLVGTAKNCTFENCRTSGSVVSGYTEGDICVGGFVGVAEGCTIKDCSTTCTVKGSLIVGGFAGELGDGTKNTPCLVENCKATGAVYSRGRAGGFAGCIENCTVSHCTATGNVTEDGSLPQTTSGEALFGGFVGWIGDGNVGGSAISYCTASGTVTATGAEDAGGFAGKISAGSAHSSIARSCSSGAVKCASGAGGFAGSAGDCSITDCYATGSATSVGMTEGGYTMSLAGGFIGGVIDTSCSLTRCYASGKVSFVSGSTSFGGGLTVLMVDPSYISMLAQYGGLDALMVASTSCYWNKGSTGQNYSSTGTGLTAAQAKNKSSFSGWDFNNVWNMGSNGPELKNVGATIVSNAKSMKVATKQDVASNANDGVFAGLLTDKSVKALQSVSNGTLLPRLYSYERYVAVKGLPYTFALSADEGASISVSGLPSGFSFSNGIISGTASAAGSTAMTITANGSAGMTTKRVPFIVIDLPDDSQSFISWKVTFEPNGGTVSPSTRLVERGMAVGDLPTPTYSGYAFDGWYTQASGGTRITSSTKVTANVTYYAHWRAAVKVKVTFGKNGGTGGDDYVTATEGSPMPTPRTAPKLAGWTFAGYWDTLAQDEQGNPKGKQYYDANMKSVRNWDKTTATTLWAKWTNKVTLGKNGGTGGDTYVTCTKGQPMPKRKMPTKSGYAFSGYWTSTGADGVKYYNADGTSAHVWDRKGDTTLWAKWTPNRYKVTFGKNGGTGGDSYVTATYGAAMPAPRTAPKKSGYVFDGYWSATGESGTCYYDANMKSAHVWDRASAATLWAKWRKPAVVKVTFGKNGGTGGDSYVTATEGGSMPTPRTAPKLSGYTFAGYWDTLALDAKGKPLGKQYYDANMKSVRNWDKTKPLTLWAKWVPASYKVTFGKNGGTGGDSYVTATYDAAMPTPRTAPKLSGYAFAGYWDTLALDAKGNPKGRQYYDANMKSVRKWDKTSTATLWAKWTPNRYKVTFGKNGGTGGDSYVTATYGAAMPAPRTAPKKSGYVFDGYWSATGESGTCYYDANMKSAHVWDRASAATLWAKWRKPAVVKVTFGKNGGTGGDNYVTATYGAAMPTPRTAPKLSGWTFAGYWDTLALDEKGNAKGKQYYDANMKSVRKWDKKSAAKLWAKWTNKVTFGKNGGTGGDNFVTCTKGQPMPKRTMPTKSGYVFDGYWTTTGKGGVKYYNSDGTSAHVWDKKGNVTLWAKWVKPVACKVTFGKNGGTGGDNYVTATTGKPMPTPRTAPTLKGWTFGGYWDTLACDASGNPLGKQYYDSNMKSVRNWDKTTAATLWAKWTVRVKLGKNGGTGGDSYVTVIKGQSFPKRTMPKLTGYAFGGYWISASSITGRCYNADGTGTSSMKWTTGGTPTIWALWTKISGCVELPPAVARRVATVAVSATAPGASAAPTAAPAFVPAGLYSGVLADGTGAFWLVLDASEDGSAHTAFLYIASEDGSLTAECTAEEVDGILLLTTEDGDTYLLDIATGSLGFGKIFS